MSDHEFDVQEWLDRAADRHMATKRPEQLHGCLDGPLPRQVRMSNVTVAVIEEAAPAMVVFTATAASGQEFTARRYA